MAKLSNIKVEIGLPMIGKIEGTWAPDENEQRAAWELYIELITRISIIDLPSDAGSLRESLSSLHSIFETTRQILREYGPDIARPKGRSALSLGYIAITVLNVVLRPLLSTWHPLLLDHEAAKPRNLSSIDHEQSWERHAEFRQALKATQNTLLEYASLLAEAARIPPLAYERQ